MTAAPRPEHAADRLVVALDVDALAEVDALVTATREWVSTYKIGARLFSAEGPRAIARVRAAGARVMLDLKYHDIPNTVAEAVGRALDHGVGWLTVHVAGGRAMLEAAVRAAGDRAAVLAVTVLTSLDAADLAEVGEEPDVEALVVRRARLALDAGCAGLVCSPREAARLRAACGAGFLLVTPGVRPAGAAPSDQKRAASAAEAVAAGVDYVVVGRPVTAAPDPGAAVAGLVRELSGR